MAVDAETIHASRDYFAHKLKAEKQRNDVLKAVQGTIPYDFVLLDTRGKPAFADGHIPGAWCAPESLEQLIPSLPHDKEIVTYCWSHD